MVELCPSCKFWELEYSESILKGITRKTCPGCDYEVVLEGNDKWVPVKQIVLNISGKL